MKMKEYYVSLNKTVGSAGEDFRPESNEIDRTRAVKVLELIPESGQNILDVGCNDGQLSKLFKKGGNRVVGIEINPYLAKEAKSRLDEVIVQDVEDPWQVPSGSFDFVILSAVIEHVYDTDFVLEEARRVLRPDGHLVVAVPNIAVFGNRIKLLFGKGIDWIGTSGEHIRAFTKPTLEFLLKKHRFRPVYWTGNRRHLPFTGVSIPYLERLFPNLCWVLISLCERMDV